MPHALLQLTKAKWEKLKKDADMKKKGKLEAFFKKLTGINVGDKIDKFVKAHANFQSAQTYQTASKVFSTADDLSKALTKFANTKEFATPDAKEFKVDVQNWSAEANDFAVKFAKFIKENEPQLRANDAAHMINALKNNDLW